LSLDRVCIALNRHERSMLSKLEQAVDLERLVGLRSAALLRGGHKLEVEGASNPALYGRDHARRLMKRIRAAV
jgi:hypothetical protein